MAETKRVDVKRGDVMLLLGTAKGIWVMRSDAARGTWEVGGPHFPGHKIYSLAYDPRKGRSRIWAGTCHNHFGVVLSHSDDFGKSWNVPADLNVKFPEGSDEALKQIWEVKLGHPGDDDTLYAGVQPAALFKSTDAGTTWEVVRGIYDHPHRKQWQPGGGGLTLHTIVPHPFDPRRMLVAISTGGVYR